MTDSYSERLKFWESRSGLGFAAGSGDINLKKLEINAITKVIGTLTSNSVLDAGCGNGFTIASLAETFPDKSFYAFDYSQGMVDSAHLLMRERGISDRISLCRASLLDELPAALQSINPPKNGFDCIYTERSLINLDTFDQQLQAVNSLWSLLAPGGSLVLCEAFHDGLVEINSYREAVGLPHITPPWHNRYLALSELSKLIRGCSQEPNIVEFSGTYYFISRIVHAREASLQGKEPSYEAAINKQAFDLPSLPMFGQSKIVIWKKP